MAKSNVTRGSGAPVLIIISCSEAKRRRPLSPAPAIDRYDGVFYKVIRKARREGRLAPGTEIVILSAKYGLLRTTSKIPFYDLRLTKAQVPRLGPRVKAEVGRILRRRKFQRIFVNVGRDYAPLLDGITLFDNAEWATGSIGKRAAQLRRWIVRAPGRVSG